jgi:hypothetical protein
VVGLRYRDGPRGKEREEIEEIPASARIVQVEILRLVEIVDLGPNRAFGGEPSGHHVFTSSQHAAPARWLGCGVLYGGMWVGVGEVKERVWGDRDKR